MPDEIECKLKINSRDDLAAKLVELGARDHGDVLEKNIVLDTDEHALKSSNRLLRIRSDNKCILTYKGPSKSSKFKRREELNCEIPDFDMIHQILKQLGYQDTWYYEKMRWTFSFDGAEIVLDEIPDLGAFIEIEGNNEILIEKILTKLGLDKDDHISESYLSLYEAYCTNKGKPLQNMEF
jgi:predicted adenylyl cyclase CyaB